MKTIVGLFDSMDQAQRAASNLEAAGIPRDDISLVANNENGRYAANNASDSGTSTGTTTTGSAIGQDAVVGAGIGGAAGLLIGLTGLAIPGLGWIATAGWLTATLIGAGTGAVVGGLVGALTQVGVPEEDASLYTEGVRRGSILVAVKAMDEQANRVAQILGDAGAVDIDQRRNEYGTGAAMAPTTMASPRMSNPSTSSASMAPSSPSVASGSMDAANGTVIPVVEEQLTVGKREVQGGGIRIYTYATETPVQQNVTLREEHLTVDRRPVDRVVTGEDLNNALQDRTINVTTTSEQPVVQKEARVVEEVTIGKQVTEHVETVQDNVRRTGVDVEKTDTTPAGRQ